MTQPSSECTCRVVRNPLCGEYPDGSGDCNEIERGPCHAVSIEERDALRERLRERSRTHHHEFHDTTIYLREWQDCEKEPCISDRRVGGEDA